MLQYLTERDNVIRKLFLTFLKIGAFTFGGGYAMIPLIQRDIVEKNHWLTDDDILEIIAIAESTPGPIAINSATFVGYRVAGFFGAMFATLGVVLPSFLIISVISMVLEQFEHLAVIQYAFNGIRAGVLALLIKALIGLYKKSPKKAISYVVMAVAFVGVAVLKVNVLAVIIACALIGLVSSFIAEKRCRDQ